MDLTDEVLSAWEKRKLYDKSVQIQDFKRKNITDRVNKRVLANTIRGIPYRPLTPLYIAGASVIGAGIGAGIGSLVGSVNTLDLNRSFNQIVSKEGLSLGSQIGGGAVGMQIAEKLAKKGMDVSKGSLLRAIGTIAPHPLVKIALPILAAIGTERLLNPVAEGFANAYTKAASLGNESIISLREDGNNIGNIKSSNLKKAMNQIQRETNVFDNVSGLLFDPITTINKPTLNQMAIDMKKELEKRSYNQSVGIVQTISMLEKQYLTY